MTNSQITASPGKVSERDLLCDKPGFTLPTYPASFWATVLHPYRFLRANVVAPLLNFEKAHNRLSDLPFFFLCFFRTSSPQVLQHADFLIRAQELFCFTVENEVCGALEDPVVHLRSGIRTAKNGCTTSEGSGHMKRSNAKCIYYFGEGTPRTSETTPTLTKKPSS